MHTFLLDSLSVSSSSDTNIQIPLKDGPTAHYQNEEFTKFPNLYHSFLGVEETMQTGTDSAIKALLLARSLGGQMKKKRYTNDGRRCAPAFAQDGKAFEDCTTTRSPDGQLKNQEWCYVDAAEKGESNWDYCKPTMDFDKIRQKNQEDLGSFAADCRRIEDEISKVIGPGEDALNRLKKVKDGQADLDNKVTGLSKEMGSVKDNLLNLFNIKEQWESIEAGSVRIAIVIEKKTEYLYEERHARVKGKMDTNEETLRKEEEKDHLKINPMILEKSISGKKDCKGMLGYEEDNTGDGLMGNYFDNEFFLGEYKQSLKPDINFDWTGSSPLPGINTSNFSVRWEGFLYAPYTSNYRLSIECDDGCTISLNNNMIVSHNMYIGTKETKARVDTWLKGEVTKKENPGKNYNKSSSKVMKLTGGNKYRIVASYFHTVHNNVSDDEKVYVQLSWSSDEFEEEIIPSTYLFSENTYPPLKVTANPEIGIVRKLRENDLAFKNSQQYVLQDIPIEYRGLNCLKLNMKHLEPKLEFTLNVPTIVYIARPSWFPNCIPTDFENTGDFLTLLQIDKPNPNVPFHNKITAKRAGLMKIYKKKIKEGNVTIPLNMGGINVKGNSLIVFFGFDSQISTPLSCGGEEKMISKPNTASFKECQVSSKYNPNYGCRNGFMGNIQDKEGSVWASAGQGIGAWISVEFTGLHQVTKVVIKNRRNPAERNLEVKVIFSNGDVRVFELENNDERQEFTIEPPIKTDSVKFEITKVSGTINNGGFYEVYGSKCVDADELEVSPEADPLERAAGINPKKMPPLFDNVEKKPYILTCKDSMANSKVLQSVKQKPGNKIKIHCLENCAAYRGSIYGDHKYSKDSVICKAAFHSQKLKAEGGLVEMIFEEGLASYKAVSRNGVKSKNKGKSDLTIKFDTADEDDSIILDNGTKVDYKDIQHGWLPAVVTNIKESQGGKVVTLVIENGEGSQQPIEMPYPNKQRIKPCGDKTKGRDCKSSRNGNKESRPMLIKFAPKTYTTSGEYLFDRGEVFGKSGNAYGWSLDMTNRMKIRTGGDKPELDTLVEFNPSSKSKWCGAANPETNCQKSSWTIKAGHGRYQVKLYVGDPEGNTHVNFQVNGQPFVTGEVVPKGDLKVFERAFETLNQLLIFTADCEENCEYAMSKLNMIELYPYQDPTENSDAIEPTPEREDPCNNGITGGRCDTGPDVVHCIYEDPTVPAASNCVGNTMMIQVPDTYRCTSQRGKYKCVLKQYPQDIDCLKFCPAQCKKGQCIG